ncbi:MAG: acyl-ACP desaturase [Actinomycetota bacterium]|nr:acyl-ACP desaturase [Actinomycetota bacterium]
MTTTLMTPTTSADLVDVLTPQVERLYERHLATTKSWLPHELIPWERANESRPRDAWDAASSTLPSGVRSALVVNLLTEDNLPYYFETINRVFANETWREWARRWTAEEMRHGIVIRDYITVTHAVDLVALEHARMHQVCGAQVPQPESAADALAYVALQELATRISHRNTGNLLEDEAGYKVMARVAADENLHYLFYRDLVSAALEVDPSGTVCAIVRQVRTFEMPGAGIPDFSAHASAIAAAGIYDLVLHHDQVLVPVVLRHWGIETIEGLSPEAEGARERIVGHIARLERVGKRLASRRA